MARSGSLCALALATAVSAPAAAQPPPASDFRLNAYTTGSQGVPVLARDARGNFVAVWDSYGQDGDRSGLFGRRFDRRGAPRGPEFPVNTFTTGHQFGQTVASDRDGRFVVAWASQSASTPGGFQVVARRFDQAGAPRGSDFAVTSPAFVQNAPDAAIDETGRLAIVWASDTSIRGRLWDADGNPLGLEFVVSSTPALVGSPDVAFAPQGGFVVVWLAGVAPGPERDVFAQRFDATGTRLGLEFRVNAVTSGFEDEPTVAFQDSGSFVVAWSSLFLPLGQRIVYQRLFTASGNPLTLDVLVDTTDDCCPRLAPGANGDLLTTWTTGATDFDVAARRFDAAGTPLETAFVVPQFTGGFQAAPDVVGSGGAYVLAWESDTATVSQQDAFARLLGWLPTKLAVDPSPVQSNGNGVLEAGETVIAVPAWTNADRAAASLTGLATSFTGPGVAPVYTILDGAAAYGTLPVGGQADCLAAANCYAIALALPQTRPAAHWDAFLQESTSTRAAMRWTVHVGASFVDVPPASGFYRFVETVLHSGVTGGCAADRYCPDHATTREQMAVMVLTAREGAGYRPVACQAGLFADVPPTSPFCPFIEELARRGVVGGCGGGNYCPGLVVSREQMAVFVLRTAEPDLQPPACGAPLFADVPASSPFCPWIEELARRGVVSGCGGGNFCPQDAVTRGQVAVFLSAAFSLTLYGP